MTSDASTAIVTGTTAYITLVGLLFVSEPDSLSRRVSRGLPRSRTLRVSVPRFCRAGRAACSLPWCRSSCWAAL